MNRPWITLDEAYLLDVPEMDEQHLALVELLNNLNSMVRRIEPSESILAAFDELVEKWGRISTMRSA